jgi:hypothetical protein
MRSAMVCRRRWTVAEGGGGLGASWRLSGDRARFGMGRAARQEPLLGSLIEAAPPASWSGRAADRSAAAAGRRWLSSSRWAWFRRDGRQKLLAAVSLDRI